MVVNDWHVANWTSSGDEVPSSVWLSHEKQKKLHSFLEHLFSQVGRLITRTSISPQGGFLEITILFQCSCFCTLELLLFTVRRNSSLELCGFAPKRVKEATVGPLGAFFVVSCTYIWSWFGKMVPSGPPWPHFFLQVDTITSTLRGPVVARAFEQTKCFTPGRGFQGNGLSYCSQM